jgi:hypothetical protein
MNVFIKLNPGQGTDLGPNFTLTANVGVLVPATATLVQLLTGITVVADDTATQVFVTSQGVCTNVLTLSISTTTTTTTSTSTTSTTTTDAGCVLSGGTVVVSPYILYSNRFIFSNSGPTDICILPTVPAYGLPFYIFEPPPQLFQDPYGTTPFPYSKVLDVVFPTGGSNSVYEYNSTTGAVGAYFGACLS